MASKAKRSTLQASASKEKPQFVKLGGAGPLAARAQHSANKRGAPPTHTPDDPDCLHSDLSNSAAVSKLKRELAVRKKKF